MRNLLLCAGTVAVVACGNTTDEGVYGVNTDDLYDTWLVTSVTASGIESPSSVTSGMRLVLSDVGYEAIVAGGQLDIGDITIDDNASPPRMDITGTNGPNAGMHMKAIYQQAPESLVISYDTTGTDYPTDFESKPGRVDFVVTYKRME